MNQTIEVQGYFGPVQMDRERFIQRWTETVGEAIKLTRSAAERRMVGRMKADMAELAGREFDRLAEAQASREEG